MWAWLLSLTAVSVDERVLAIWTVASSILQDGHETYDSANNARQRRKNSSNYPNYLESELPCFPLPLNDKAVDFVEHVPD